MTLIKVKVVAPEGRYYFGLGGRECGQEYELPEAEARKLTASDPGLMIEVAAEPEGDPAPKKAGRAAKPAEVTDNG